MDIKYLAKTAHELYLCRPQRPFKYRWILVFLLRCFLHKKECEALHNFFKGEEIKEKYLESHKFVWFQLTRENFYKGSSTKERLKIITDSWNFFEKKLSEEIRRDLYTHHSNGIHYTLWEEDFDGKKLSISINNIDGDCKEGCMGLYLNYNGATAYHIAFWVNYHNDNPEVPTAYIGCYQGTKEELDLNKELTKLLHACRPQNLIFMVLQDFLKILGITKLYGVSSKGHYSNKYARADRKPMGSYDEFWKECGGKPSDDYRFYELPIDQQRKSYEEIPSKKRSTYRKRYELLDRITLSMKEKLCNCL